MQIRAKIADLETEIASEYRKLTRLQAPSVIDVAETRRPDSATSMSLSAAGSSNMSLSAGPSSMQYQSSQHPLATSARLGMHGGMNQPEGFPPRGESAGYVNANRADSVLQRPSPPPPPPTLPPHRGAPSAITSVDLSGGNDPAQAAQSPGQQAPPPRRGGFNLTFTRRTAETVAGPRQISSPAVSDDTVSYLSASSQISAGRDEGEVEASSHLSATSTRHNQSHDTIPATWAGVGVNTNRPAAGALQQRSALSPHVIDLTGE